MSRVAFVMWFAIAASLAMWLATPTFTAAAVLVAILLTFRLALLATGLLCALLVYLLDRGEFEKCRNEMKPSSLRRPQLWQWVADVLMCLALGWLTTEHAYGATYCLVVYVLSIIGYEAFFAIGPDEKHKRASA